MGKGLQVAAEGLPPKIVKISEELSCQLNDVQWQNASRDLADAHKEVGVQEQRKKDINKELTHDVDLVKAKRNKLADMVSTKRELREVTVEVKYDYELGTVEKTRTDTGEIISTRDMTDQERQAELDFHDANDVIEEGRAAERAEGDEPEQDEETATDEPEDVGETETPADAPDPEAEADEDDDDDWDLDDEEPTDGEEPKA